jgi:hypothetical protein
LWFLGQRRTFLIDRRGQLRTTLLTVGVVAVLLVALIVSLHVSRVKSTEALVAKVPELAELLGSQNATTLILQLVSALVFLLTVGIVAILETHKTAGAAFNLGRCLARLRDGQSGVRARLRAGDNLQALARVVNELGVALDERRFREAEILRVLAERVERVGDPGEARELAEILREQAAGHAGSQDRPTQERSAPWERLPSEGEATPSEAGVHS